MRHITLLITMTLLLGACGGQPTPENTADLPTVAVLPTDTPTPTATPTPTPSDTPTATATTPPTVTPSPTASITPSPTLTDTLTPTPSDTPTITPTVREKSALELLGDLAAQATILPPDFTVEGTPVNPQGGSGFVVPPQGGSPVPPTPPPNAVFSGTPPDCPYPLPGGFAAAVQNAPGLLAAVGCPIGAPPVASTLASAYQPFQNGFMVWVDSPTGNVTIYVFGENGTYLEYPDTWNPATDPERGGETPPDGLLEPVRGFGKLWRENPIVRDKLGWALSGEVGGQAARVQHDNGALLAVPQRSEVLALAEDGSWQSTPGAY